MTRPTLRQLRFHGVRDFRFDDVEAQTLGADDVRVRIAYNGVCGTDLHLFKDPANSGMPYAVDDEGNVIPEPVGHEYSGEITEVGAAVQDLAVGDRVAVIPMGYCGDCDICVAGLPRFMCRNFKFHAGGVGEEVVVEHRFAYRLPEGVDLVQGALVEPMAVCLHSAKVAELTSHDVAVIAGAGPIGIGLLFSLRYLGISDIVVSEPNPERRATVESFGVRAIDPINEDLAEAVRSISNGLGATVFFDAAGTAPVFRQGIEVLGPRGKYVAVAIHTKPLELELFPLQAMEKRIYTSLGYDPSDFHAVIDAMAEGAYPTDEWVEIRPARDALDVIEELSSGKGSKVLLEASQIA